MKPIKLRKVTDDYNLLRFNSIEILTKEIFLTYTKEIPPNSIPHTFYEYFFLCIADGKLTRIHENVWDSFDCYEVVE